MSLRLFFVHIPKTAGTTFNAFLDQQFYLAQIAPREVFDKYELRMQRNDFQEYLNELKQFSLFRGHYGYEIFKDFIDEYITLTILRDPFKRVISLYNDWRSKSEEHLKHTRDSEKSLALLAKQLSFQEFFQAEHPLIPLFFHNGQARQLAYSLVSDFEEDKLQDLALHNLNKIDYVGTTEAFDLFRWILCEQFGWHYTPQLQVLNAARGYLRLEDLDDATLATIADKNRVDLALYGRAKERALETANRVMQAPPLPKTYLDFRNQSHITITMAHPIPGTGWHARAGSSDRLWRWTGPNLETTLFLRLDPRRYMLVIRVIFVTHINILHQSKISINSTPIPIAIDKSSGDFFIKGTIPAALLNSASLTRLAITVPQNMASTDINPTANDARQRGLAIQEIVLATAEPTQAEPTLEL
ncbi:MAG: sulfotransferase family 2 domain-containing protein [Leptolyngbyaceae cyanobacterium]